jgi:predicted Ser/Thr protein kinase
MTPDEFKTVEPLFHQALELPPGEERERFLQDHCPKTLAGFLRGLLEADDVQRASRSENEIPLPCCGPYQAESVLGSGGMGLVYRARREDRQFEQTVALKVLRSVARTESARARFRTERQILAQMQHPHIAALHDGGVSAEGEPYLVMEYVDGEPLDRYCDRQRLSIHARLALFSQVLDAVEYAHRNLIVHGDVKPSNILVTADGVVKLLDFGTSRFVGEETQTTLAAVMTPKYASPEQLRGDRLTTTSDVFSLGVVLYELLTGAPAFPSAASFLSVMVRAVEETHPTDPHLAVTEEAATARGCSLAQLKESVRGDLASIVQNALAYDPARRYQSVAAFAADLERFREHRPVLARRQTALYRMGKFVKRRRVPVTAALVIGIVLAGMGGYALRQQQQALEQGRRAQVTNRFLIRLLQSINPMYGGRWDMRASELVDNSVSRAEKMLVNEPESLTEFQLTASGNYLFTHASADSIKMAEQGLATARRSGDPGLQALAYGQLGWLQAVADKCPDALRSAAAGRSLAAAHDNTIRLEWKILVTTSTAQTVYYCGGDLASVRRQIMEAVRITREIPKDSLQVDNPPPVTKSLALGIAGEVLGCEEGRPFRQESITIAHGEGLGAIEGGMLRDEGNCMVRKGEPAKAIPLLRRSVDIIQAVFGAQSFLTRSAQSDLAYALAQSGEAEEAIREGKQAVIGLDRSAIRSLSTRLTVVLALVAAGDAKDAAPLVKETAAETVGLNGQVGRFVVDVEEGDFSAAKPYRAAAEKGLSLTTRSPLGVQIEKALRKAREHGIF